MTDKRERTGFKDTAGNDICDGDIVMQHGRVTLELVDVTKPRMGLKYAPGRYRVIGNKYNDKHLLEG